MARSSAMILPIMGLLILLGLKPAHATSCCPAEHEMQM